MNMSKKIISIAFATLVALPSFAGEGDDLAPWEEKRVATRTVQVGDLDLATAGDRKVLQQRLRRAARQVCEEIEPSEPGRRLANLECVSEVVDETLARMPVAITGPGRQVAGGIPVSR